MRLLRTKGREGLPAELSFVDLGQAAEDQNGTDVRKYRGAERVESLSEGQSAMRSARLAQQADQRICHDLDDGDSGGQHEQSEEKGREKSRVGGGNEQQAADRHRDQPNRRAAHVAQALDQASGRRRDQEIGEKKGRLDQHDLRIVEVEQMLELGDQDVVETGDSTKDEKEGKYEQTQVGDRSSRCRVGGCRFAGCQVHDYPTSFFAKAAPSVQRRGRPGRLRSRRRAALRVGI